MRGSRDRGSPLTVHLRRAFVVASLGSAPFVTAAAQCADGSPPPCRAATVAAAPRRVNPPLDDRTWIVVPFDNLRQTQEIDWLRAASVNLLYLDMSRWRDIRVIDDERVADLMREVPEVRDPQKLDLNAGLAVARRAGARNLVMGDLLMLGSRTAVTAKVYDVRSGQRVRSVQEATAVQDSVMPLFGKLAQKILNVAPPEGAKLGTVGTNSVAAYQEYLRGVQALNAFDLVESRQRFLQALRLDSTFALAHFKLSVVGGWANPNDTANRSHAEAAGRLSAGLPARERGLIKGHLSQARRLFGDACDEFSALLRADSSDVEAWYGLGDCRYHDIVAEPVGGDTTRVRFRGDLNESLRAFRRALALDPTYHLAYQHILDAYVAEARFGQRCAPPPEQRCTTYGAAQIRSGDTLIFNPVPLPRDTVKFAAQREEYARTSRRRNLESGLAIAEQWFNSSPNEQRARAAYGAALLAVGRVREAESILDRVAFDNTQSGMVVQLFRAEARVKMWRPEVVRLYDSLRAPAAGQPSGRMTLGTVITLLAPVFGRMTEYDSLMLAPRRTPVMQRANAMYVRTMLGVPPDSAAAIERAAFDEVAAAGPGGRPTVAIAASLAFGLRVPRASWPPLDTMVASHLYQPAFALARGDTNRLRAAAQRLDSLTAGFVRLLVPDTGMSLVAADAFLILRDSASALRMMRRMLDTGMTYTGLTPRTAAFPYATILPRSMLLRADLAAALGHRDEARVWYQRFIDLWATAVPELQPVVARAKRSLAAL